MVDRHMGEDSQQDNAADSLHSRLIFSFAMKNDEMTDYYPSRMPPDTWIAGRNTVNDWLALRGALIDHPDDIQKWAEAYDFFRLRIDTRFLRPIRAILAIDEKLGEGHSACAIQCMLIEFLEALFQGKVYRPPIPENDLNAIAERLGILPEILANHTQPTEYTSSAGLFVSFLTKRYPFSQHFNKSRARVFYYDIRCGLLHEAATKGLSKVRADEYCNSNCLIQDLGNGLIINRDSFQRALIECIDAYRAELLSKDDFKKNFIRKMDDIAGVDRCFYFAYGSNLDSALLLSRIRYIHSSVKAKLNSYGFRYNKRSNDGTSKANIVPSKDEVVWGVCYEIDCCDFRRLHEECEKGYDVKKVWTETEESPVIAETLQSSRITAAFPSLEYTGIVVKGARKHNLPEDYIAKYLTGN